MSDISHSEPVTFISDDTPNTYYLPIFNAIGDWGGYALVEWVGPRTYTATAGFCDIHDVKEYADRRATAGAIGLRVYFYEPGTWFGQVLVPQPGDEWPDDYEIRNFARRAQILKQIGADVPCAVPQ